MVLGVVEGWDLEGREVSNDDEVFESRHQIANRI